jgi:hypothetical protein
MGVSHQIGSKHLKLPVTVIIVSNQNVEQSVIYVKVSTNTKTQTFVLNKYNFEWPRNVFRMPTDFIISLLLLSDLDEPLGKIGTVWEFPIRSVVSI